MSGEKVIRYSPTRTLKVVIDQRVKRVLADYKLEPKITSEGAQVDVAINSHAMLKLLNVGVKSVRGMDNGLVLVY